MVVSWKGWKQGRWWLHQVHRDPIGHGAATLVAIATASPDCFHLSVSPGPGKLEELAEQTTALFSGESEKHRFCQTYC
jgi:hypothetical protein